MRRCLARAFAVLVLLVAAAPAHAAPRLLGVNEEGSPGKPGTLDRYVRRTGARPRIVMWYQSWSEPLYYADQAPRLAAAGSVPMITWSPATASGGIPLRQIALGAWDRYITRSAHQAAAYGRPVLIRFAHEMNLPDSAYGPGRNGNTPADFRLAWRRVVLLFRLAGARNVSWVWSPNVDCLGRCPFEAFFPGDDQVDWVGLDGYNDGVRSPVGRWSSLADVFGASYDRLVALSAKPVMLAETASAEEGGSKARWILQGLLHDVPHRLPRVQAVVWFDRRKEHDWRIDSSPSALAAFRVVAHSRLYGGDGVAGVPFRLPRLTPTATPSGDAPVTLGAHGVASRGSARLSLRCDALLTLPCEGALGLYHAGRAAGGARYAAAAGAQVRVKVPLGPALQARLVGRRRVRVQAVVFPAFGALPALIRAVTLTRTG